MDYTGFMLGSLVKRPRAVGSRAWRRTRDCLRESAIWNGVAVPLRDLEARCQMSEQRVPPSN